MLSPLDPSRDLRLSGQVIYTGHSSMEVAVKLESVGAGKPDETVMIGEPDSDAPSEGVLPDDRCLIWILLLFRSILDGMSRCKIASCKGSKSIGTFIAGGTKSLCPWRTYVS